MIGIRLKLARRAAGFSLRSLAAAIGHRVTAQAIGKYERNEAMPGSGVLLALADALNASVDYPLGDPDLVLEDLEFRKNAFTTKRGEAQVEATVRAHLERYLCRRGDPATSQRAVGRASGRALSRIARSH